MSFGRDLVNGWLTYNNIEPMLIKDYNESIVNLKHYGMLLHSNEGREQADNFIERLDPKT